MKKLNGREVLHYEPSQRCCDTPSRGDLFPDLLRLDYNVENRGRVASIFVESLGIGIQDRRLAFDEKAWEDCMKQPNFRACYDLSMARLVLQEAVLKLS